MEWITIVSLILVIAYQGYFTFKTQQANDNRERELLDRIMCTDYATYINSQVVRTQAEKPLDKIYEDQQERGIPI